MTMTAICYHQQKKVQLSQEYKEKYSLQITLCSEVKEFMKLCTMNHDLLILSKQ